MSLIDVGPRSSSKIIMTPKSLVAASLKPFILSVLIKGPSYGYEIIQSVHDLTGGSMLWTTSTLYPVLHRLETEELLESYWQEVDKGPNRKYYKLTQLGRERLKIEKEQWMTIHDALTRLWAPALEPGLG
jgi:PadR family transcriptional regulator